MALDAGAEGAPPPPTRAEYQRKQATYAETARAIVRGTEVNPRRQNKVIAAVVRRDPRLILPDSVTLTDAERGAFRDRVQQSPLTTEDFETALSQTPISIKNPPDPENLTRNFKKFSGDETQQRRMRRVIAETTKGSLDSQDEVVPEDLHDFVYSHFPNAARFEEHLPQLLESIDTRQLGITNYTQAIAEVGLALYGSQWTYLQQGRLAEAEMRSAQAVVVEPPTELIVPARETPPVEEVPLPEVQSSGGQVPQRTEQSEIRPGDESYQRSMGRFIPEKIRRHFKR